MLFNACNVAYSFFYDLFVAIDLVFHVFTCDFEYRKSLSGVFESWIIERYPYLFGYVINQEIFKKYGDLRIDVIICNGINNGKAIAEIKKEYNEISSNVRNKFFDISDLSNYPVIRK